MSHQHQALHQIMYKMGVSIHRCMAALLCAWHMGRFHHYIVLAMHYTQGMRCYDNIAGDLV